MKNFLWIFALCSLAAIGTFCVVSCEKQFNEDKRQVGLSCEAECAPFKLKYATEDACYCDIGGSIKKVK